jgi:nitrogen fixation protein NifQ
MKWKKFFYRSLCELEGFVLCASPSCRECSDFHDCFGDESGESALARLADASSRDR